jgi:hypothetical protein
MFMAAGCAAVQRFVHGRMDVLSWYYQQEQQQQLHVVFPVPHRLTSPNSNLTTSTFTTNSSSIVV